MNRQQLQLKYQTYQSQGTSVFTVTLSSYVQDDDFAKSDRMRHYWDNHFIYHIRKCLPVRAKIDHDMVLEKSPDGYYHYHGLLAVEQAYGGKLWRDDSLCTKLKRALDSHARTGKYRSFCVNAHLIEPATNIPAWCNYITKQVDVHH
jgi:hypothetical protein